jgi:hypothetical protein
VNASTTNHAPFCVDHLDDGTCASANIAIDGTAGAWYTRDESGDTVVIDLPGYTIKVTPTHTTVRPFDGPPVVFSPVLPRQRTGDWSAPA